MRGKGATKGTAVWDPTASTLCACQYGNCGWCADMNNHQRCAWVQHPDWCLKNYESPATYITHRRGGHVLVAVYEVGYNHRWVCACHVAGHGQTGAQLDLFAAVS